MKAKFLVQSAFTPIEAWQGTSAVKEALIENGFLVVMEKGEFKGILTPKDIVKAPRNLVVDCLGERPAADHEQSVEAVLEIMKHTGFNVLPVFGKNEFMGVIQQSDVMDCLAAYKEELEQHLQRQKATLERERHAHEKSEEKYRAIVEDQSELICRFKPDHTLRFVNQAYARYWGKTPGEMVGQSFLTMIPEQDHEKVKAHLASFTPEDNIKGMEHRTFDKTGNIRWQQWVDRAFFDESGRLVEFQSVGRDITALKQAQTALKKAHDELEERVTERTAELVAVNQQLKREIKERKKAEKHIKSALKEKELLLQELHHRVKNNLQIISGLISITGKLETPDDFSEFALDLQSKIGAMALIHEKIYVADSLSHIGSQAFITDLFEQVQRLYATQDVSVDFNIDDLTLDLAKAVPLGLVLNEVFCNIFKHAFVDANSPKVAIGLKKMTSRKVCIKVSDNGVGIADEDIQSAATMGMSLIRGIIVEQMNGCFRIQGSQGTTCTIEFDL